MKDTALQRHATLDGMRGIAAMTVMVHHFTMRTDEWELFGSAQIAVDLFFCISGFVIAQAYQAKILAGMTLPVFIRRRIERLYPAFAAGMSLGLVALLMKYYYGLTDYELPNIFTAAVLNFLYLPYFANFSVQFFDQTVTGVVFPLDGPAWTLFFGFVGNFVYFAAMKRRRWVMGLLWALAAAGFFVATKIYGESAGWSRESFLGGFPRVIYAFLAGVLVYQWRDRLSLLPKLPVWLLTGLILAMFSVPGFQGHT